MGRIIVFVRTGLAAMAIAAAAAPVRAAEETPKALQSVAMEAVALPIVVDGRLINYVFVSIRLELTPKADGAQVRSKEQFFRDDLVRVGHRSPFTRRDDYTKIDEAKVKGEVMRFAATLIGPGMIQSVNITKQVSQKMLTLPSVAQSRAPEIVP